MKWALRWFPISFQKKYGHEMWLVYQESYQDILKEGGRFAAFKYALSSSLDFLKVALHERILEVEMLKSRPQVLIPLLGLAGITVFCSVQYGLWNAKAGFDNPPILQFFDTNQHRVDVTLQPEYRSLTSLIEGLYPEASIRIVESSIKFDPLQKPVSMLSVAVLAPALDMHLKGLKTIQRNRKVNETDLKTLMQQGNQLENQWKPVQLELQKTAFDFQSLCVTSNVYAFEVASPETPEMSDMNSTQAMARWTAHLILVHKAQQFDPQLTVFGLDWMDRSTDQHMQPLDALEACTFAPNITGTGEPVLQQGKIRNMNLGYFQSH